MKSTSPKGVALFSSSLIAGTTFLIHLLSALFFRGSILYLPPLLTAIVVFVVSYVVIFYSVERFIYGRVKLIYKAISSKKIQKETKKSIARNPDILSEVNERVIHWADEQTKEITKLKEQEEFRREFLGNLAHELKTPVFSIQGYILTLFEGGLEDPQINRQFLERAAKGVDRITSIIEDLDTINKLESGIMDLHVTRTNVVLLAEEVIESLEMKAREKNISLGFNKPYDRPIWVNCDEGKIAQVLTNLLVNAINYGKEGGKAHVRFFDMDKNILVEVADDGLGIAQEHLPRLFERFYRVDKSRSRHAGGSGLGLAIVKHIIEAHKQTINVRSTEDVGTTFAFTLSKAK